jgi:hypothetical protein
MKRRAFIKLTLLGLIAALVGIVAFVADAYRPKRISRASYEKIKMDMTRAEVDALLGAPAGQRRLFDSPPDPPGISAVHGDINFEKPENVWAHMKYDGTATVTLPPERKWLDGPYVYEPELFSWVGDDCLILVAFDEQRRVSQKQFATITPTKKR